MHILIAPNAFKHSLDASEAAFAIQDGLLQSRLACTCTCFPIGDGGDGTANLIIAQRGGTLVPSIVHDALGRNIHTSFGLIDEGMTAVIEMANASGIRTLKDHELNPLLANSFGTGEQIKAALDLGVKKVIIAMGGTATVDGGIGILRALGAKCMDAAGNEIATPGALGELVSIDTVGLDTRIPACEFIILCDVNNPLIGTNGAAEVFAPQKGAKGGDVQQLATGLSKFAEVADMLTGKAIASLHHGGAAGGAAAGLHGFLDARLVNGIDYYLHLTEFNAALAKADLVITGEGSIDAQTLEGKGPIGVARQARLLNKIVVAMAGKVPLEPHPGLQQYFDVLMPISHQPEALTAALQHTRLNLQRSAFTLGDILAVRRVASA